MRIGKVDTAGYTDYMTILEKADVRVLENGVYPFEQLVLDSPLYHSTDNTLSEASAADPAGDEQDGRITPGRGCDAMGCQTLR